MNRLLLAIIALLMIPTVTVAPEGAVRDGSHLGIVLCWLLLVPVVCLARLFDKSASLPSSPSCLKISWVDLAVVASVGWSFLSWIWLLINQTGNVRYADNMIAIIIFSGIFYLLIRLLAPMMKGRDVALIFLALLVPVLAEVFYSFYAWFLRNGAIREAFLANPEAMLRAGGLNIVRDSPEWMLMESRILGSSSPIGTYGLANTLGAVIAPFFFITLVQWLRGKNNIATAFSFKELFQLRMLVFPMVIVAFGWCIILTQSRAAVLALLIVCCGFGFYLWIRHKKLFKNWTAITGVFIVVKVAMVAVLIAFPHFVHQALKSIYYRLEYWQSSIEMIKDYPIFGVGPGNFQTIYPQYILPQASEVVADPHNFFFESATVFGVPAAIFFLNFIAMLFVFASLGRFSNPSEKSEVQLPTENTENTRTILPWSVGLFVGFVITFFYSQSTQAPIDPFYLVGAILAIVGGYFLLITQRIVFSTSALLAAMTVLLLDLCVTGGIFYLPTATVFWFCAALLANRDSKPLLMLPIRPTLFTVCGGSIVAALLFRFYFLIPVTTGNALYESVLSKVERGKMSMTQAVKILDESLEKTDPHSIVLRRLHYEYAVAIFARFPNEQNRITWEKSQRRLLREAPSNSGICEAIGLRELEHYQATRHPDLLRSAKTQLETATRLAPTDAAKKALYAITLKESHEPQLAQETARKALAIDESTPHRDRKLSDAHRSEMEKLVLP